jgi:hypothetical protein
VGRSKTAAEFSGKVARATDNLRRVPPEVARKNAKTAEDAMGAAVASMSGGDNRLSGAGRVGVDTSTSGGRVDVSPRGPVHLVENDTRPHGGHPGTRGKGQWKRARDQLAPRVARDVHQAATTATRKAFG